MDKATKKNVALLSNITVDLVAAKLCKRYEFYLPEGFDTWVQEVLDPSSGLYKNHFDAVVLLLDGTEARAWKNRDEAVERLDVWKQGLTMLGKNMPRVPIFVSSIDIRENRIKSLSERKFAIDLENDWYQFVQGLTEKNASIYQFDLADTIAEIGRKQFYSDKIWYMSSMPYSRDGLNIVAAEIGRALDAAFSTRKKIIVVDLDNTLWGGVVGEDGMAGIELSDHKEGQRYFDFQRQLLEMKRRGVLLAIISKNNAGDAENAIRNHPAMLLREDDFVSRKINWESKICNLKAIEREMNITEAGFIFIDDNPVEREIVQGECPEILVPEFPADTTKLLSFAEEMWFDNCRLLRVLDEDLKKTLMYQDEAKRKTEINSALSLDEYVAKLEIVVDIHKVRTEELERTVQLCGKTNQFNVTTKRYTQAEVEHMASAPNHDIYVVHSSDKYGDNGLISVIILIEQDEDVYIDTFLMSCRVMGRKLEEVILNELAARYSRKQRMIGEYIPTAKNAPVKELYDRLGFELLSDENGHKMYQMDISGYERKPFRCFKKVLFEE